MTRHGPSLLPGFYHHSHRGHQVPALQPGPGNLHQQALQRHAGLHVRISQHAFLPWLLPSLTRSPPPPQEAHQSPEPLRGPRRGAGPGREALRRPQSPEVPVQVHRPVPGPFPQVPGDAAAAARPMDPWVPADPSLPVRFYGNSEDGDTFFNSIRILFLSFNTLMDRPLDEGVKIKVRSRGRRFRFRLSSSGVSPVRKSHLYPRGRNLSFCCDVVMFLVLENVLVFRRSTGRFSTEV